MQFSLFFLFLNLPNLGYFTKACFACLAANHLPYLILPPIGKSEILHILKLGNKGRNTSKTQFTSLVKL